MGWKTVEAESKVAIVIAFDGKNETDHLARDAPQ
jgi:hypothetical protein